MPNIRWLLAVITAVHRWIFRVSRGRLGGRVLWLRFLLLKHVGRRTGVVRETPLLYVEDAGCYVVAASNMGDDRHPAWYLNLGQRPRASVLLGRGEVEVVAREATAEEADALWPKLQEAYRWYEDYRQRASRRIPLVILEPAEG